MTPRSLLSIRCVGLAVLAAGCGSEAASAGRPGEPVARQCSPIVGGAPDDRHSGVVALLDEEGALACTGTLISAGAKPAVLTAAHCLRDPIVTVASGTDYAAATGLTYLTLETFIHPDFDRQTAEFDFAILLIEPGVDPAWVLPVLSPEDDDLAPGATLRFVGYGSTDAPIGNTLRNEVKGTVANLTATSFAYLQEAGGPCSGDSGGPALIDVGGKHVVAGVTSYGEGGCWARGVSARASAASAFIASLDLESVPCSPPKPMRDRP
jgi:hypothetical protein